MFGWVIHMEGGDALYCFHDIFLAGGRDTDADAEAEPPEFCLSSFSDFFRALSM
jgi:hypothetical protein